MSTQKAQVTIKGLSPGLLQHSFPMVPVEALEKKPPKEQAEIGSYKNDGKYYVPGTAVQRTLVNGATYSKGKGRGSLQKVAAACLFVSPEVIVLSNQEPSVDSRPVVVPATKGRVLRHRHCFNPWEISFEVEWDDTLLEERQVRRILDDSGSRVGLLDFRPEKKGPFGRFMVTKWEMVKE